MSSNSFWSALDDFWRVDNKHGLYPQRSNFDDVKIKYSGVIYLCITIVMLIIGVFFCVGGF